MTAGPHRSADLVALCNTCKAPAALACLRCGRPQCELHKTVGDERCAACEADWRHRELALAFGPRLKPDLFRTYKRAVLFPSMVVTVLMAALVAIVGLLTAGLGAAIFGGLYVALFLFVTSTLVGSGLFAVIGAPFLAKRKLDELRESLVYDSAKRNFLAERAPPGEKS